MWPVVLVDLYDTSLLLMTQNQKPFINMTPTHTYTTRNRKLVSSLQDKVKPTSTCTNPITETSKINLTKECKRYMSRDMRCPTMQYVRLAKAQTSLRLLGLELAKDPPPPPRGNFVHYDFLKLHYIRHKIKDVSPLRVAALTCNITLYTLPPK